MGVLDYEGVYSLYKIRKWLKYLMNETVQMFVYRVYYGVKIIVFILNFLRFIV